MLSSNTNCKTTRPTMWVGIGLVGLLILAYVSSHAHTSPAGKNALSANPTVEVKPDAYGCTEILDNDITNSIDLGPVYQKTLAECQEICATNAECKCYAHLGTACYPKKPKSGTSCGGKLPHAGVTSGVCEEEVQSETVSASVCTPAGGPVATAFAPAVAPKDGVIVGMKLTHTSGEMYFCAGGGAYPHCSGVYGMALDGGHLAIFVTKADGTTVMYPTPNTRGYTPASPTLAYANEFYQMTPAQHNDPSLTFNGPHYAVKAGDEFRIYTGETMHQHYHGDNSGQTCNIVEFMYLVCPTGQQADPATLSCS